MKIKVSIISLIVGMISTGLLAQDTNVTAAPPASAPAAPAEAVPAAPIPAPAPAIEPAPAATASTNAPAKKTAKKKSHKKAAKAAKAAAKKPAEKAAPAAASQLKTTPLVAGPAVVSANHVNVRGRAGLVGEIVTRLTNGEPVNVIEEIHLKHSGPEEPSAWARIGLPADANAWIKSSYIDASKTVSAKKLNVRGGPSENYPVIGTLEKGDAVTEVESKGEWTKIQAPTNAFAFVAAEYLSQEPAALAALNPAPAATAPATPEAAPASAPTPAPTTIAENPTVAPAPTENPSTPATPVDTNAAAAPPSAPSAAPAPVIPVIPTPEITQESRVVTHEGIVRHTGSIQAPTSYELISVDNHQAINYLYTTSTNLDLSRYKGLHILVTGEEGLDERWKNTPVMTIQQIHVLD